MIMGGGGESDKGSVAHLSERLEWRTHQRTEGRNPDEGFGVVNRVADP